MIEHKLRTDKEIHQIDLFGGISNIKVARKSLIAKAQRAPKFKSRVVRRCNQCGRKQGYMRDFDLCRICFREAAHEGHIPGIKKSSW